MTMHFPTKAVILAAGSGSRLRPLTDLRPKPLVEVNGTPILHNALRNLEALGVDDVTIVVGYRKDAIQYSCGTRFGNLAISYVESNVFDQTGSAYSLWLARDALLSGDTYLLEGDVFFEIDALRKLSLYEMGWPVLRCRRRGDFRVPGESEADGERPEMHRHLPTPEKEQ